MQKLYQLFNRQIFDDKLPACKIRTRNLKGMSGRTEAVSDRPKLLIYIDLHKRLTIADRYDTLLHEMVHVWQYENDLDMDHGRTFWKKVYQIKRLYGIEIYYGGEISD